MVKEDISMLINVTDAIYGDYIALMNLEITNNKNSEKYNRLLCNLKHYISIFDNILNRITPCYQMSLDVYNYLVSLERFKSSTIDKKLSLSFITKIENKDEMVFGYIKNRIYQKLLYDVDYTLTTQNVLFEEIEDIGLKEVLEFKNAYQYSLINDIYTLFLTIVNKMLNRVENRKVIDKFTKIKYSYGLILPVLEEYLINRNFEIDAKTYIVHHAIADFYQQSEKNFDSSKREIVLGIISANIGFIKYLYDTNLNNYEILSLAINTEAIIRSCLLAADDETRNILLNMLNSLSINLNQLSNYQRISTILKNIPNKINDDLSLIQTINFGIKKD